MERPRHTWTGPFYFRPMSLRSDHRIRTLGNLEFFARQAVEGFITGMHKSPYHGFSVEFAEHRLYNKGESTRHIDWKLYARTEKLFTKRYEEETNLRCHVIIDASSSMHYPTNPENEYGLNKLGFAVYASAVLTELFRRQRDAVGLTVFADNLRLQTRAGSGGAHLRRIYHELETLLEESKQDVRQTTSVADTLHMVSESIPRRSLVVIFSDMMDNSKKANDLFPALQHLRHNKHEVILFHLNESKKEIDFSFDNRPYTFVDMESGEEIKLNPGEIKAQYKEQIQKFLSDLKLRCSQYRIDFVDCDINKGFDKVLLQYLIKRQKMF
jgi:uncharacterized protein (DUF58 family)